METGEHRLQARCLSSPIFGSRQPTVGSLGEIQDIGVLMHFSLRSVR